MKTETINNSNNILDKIAYILSMPFKKFKDTFLDEPTYEDGFDAIKSSYENSAEDLATIKELEEHIKVLDSNAKNFENGISRSSKSSRTNVDSSSFTNPIISRVAPEQERNIEDNHERIR